MPDNTDAAGRWRSRTGLDTGEFDRTDRILLGACAAVWLAALGAGVAATVALVDLGTGHAQSTGESDTPWLLYAVIAISAAVIIGAVPLLLRARRAALEESPPRWQRPFGPWLGSRRRFEAPNRPPRNCECHRRRRHAGWLPAPATRHVRPSARRRAR